MYLLAVFISFLLSVAFGQQPVVNTTYGRVQGQTLATHYERNVNSFHGIPFAKPPVGNLRFAVSKLLQDNVNSRVHMIIN